MARLLPIFALVGVLAWPSAPSAWGVDVHRRITGRALDGLPEPLRSFFAPHRAFVVEHSVDPDMWRIVGQRTDLGPEDPNHFLDLDDLDEPEPWTGVPRDWDAYLKRYGQARTERGGRLPWRVVDIYGRLVAAFKQLGTGTAPYAAENARYLSAVIAHYLEDGLVPLHAVGNYDGQLTNQRGLHSRFETQLALRNWSRIPTRVTITPISDIKTFVFDRLTEGAKLAREVLAADRRAVRGTPPVYDDRYYAAMYRDLRPILDARASGAANAVASAIVQAWTDGGKPRLQP
jgi:hypothetical protein